MMTSAKWLAFSCAVWFIGSSVASGETWAPASGTNQWITPASWVEGTIPNAIGATAIFNSPTGTRNMDLNGQFTVGSISIDNNSTFSNNIRNYNISGDLLTFDAAGAGPATITSSGTGTNQNIFKSDMFFQDDVVADVTNLVGNSNAGALSLTGNIFGPGGLIKNGDGEMTMAYNSGDTSQVKQYTGASVLNAGRWRTSFGGAPTMTSSFTINGGQLDLITNNSTYTFGTGSMILNGQGPTSGPFAVYPGAIRPESGLTIAITNDVTLQSDSSIDIISTSTPSFVQGQLTLPGIVSGPGKLIAGQMPGDPTRGGRIVLSGANLYTGGTNIQQGEVEVSGTSATLGTGDVFVDGVSVNGVSQASGILTLDSGVANAIADTATLTITGDSGADAVIGGFVNLGSGINETVGHLILGGTTETTPGTYGSSASTATFKLDQYFSGAGVITLAAPAGVPGDYNNNGVVDMADYVLWRNGGPLQNEVDSTGTVDGADYDAWRARFGNTSGSGSSLQNAAVPEPSTILLFSLLFSFGVLISKIRPAVGA